MTGVQTCALPICAPLRVNDGKGLIEFTAQGGAYDKDGLTQKSLTGTIKFPTGTGRGDTTIQMRYDYKVAKATYQVDAGSLPPLYLGCKNILSVSSPAMGALWNPSFTASGGSVFPGGKKGQVVIVPTSKSISINVINAGTTLGTETYKVARVPRPRLEYYINGQLVNDRTGVQASMARSIMVKAVAEENFANYSPDDARFQVAEIQVFLARGTRPQGTVSISGPSGSLNALASKAQAGDRLVVEIKSVQRKNFKGEITDAGISIDSKSIPLN